MYLVPDPGQDEDNQDQENLKDPQDAGQGAEEVAASPNTPGQEPDNELVMVRGAQHVSHLPGGGGAPGGCLGHTDVVAGLGHGLGRHPAANSYVE